MFFRSSLLPTSTAIESTGQIYRFEDEVDQHLYSSGLHSEACRQLVELQIEAGLKRVLTCDFSPAPTQVVQRQLGPLRKALAACMSLFEDRMPRL